MSDGGHFTCRECGSDFSVSRDVLARYPGWTPPKCMKCRTGTPQKASAKQKAFESAHGDPQTGVFTDGHCEPNPGAGGWAAAKVLDSSVVAERRGFEENTTNNRMELRALIEGLKLLEADETFPVFSDSELCVNIATKWADQWAKSGWRRGKNKEEVKNLDLVQELFETCKAHPNADIQWIKGHAGYRWNEYVDVLSRPDREKVP